MKQAGPPRSPPASRRKPPGAAWGPYGVPIGLTVGATPTRYVAEWLLGVLLAGPGVGLVLPTLIGAAPAALPPEAPSRGGATHPHGHDDPAVALTVDGDDPGALLHQGHRHAPLNPTDGPTKSHPSSVIPVAPKYPLRTTGSAAGAVRDPVKYSASFGRSAGSLERGAGISFGMCLEQWM